jgi:3-dehydroquinate dehydratase II
MLESSRSALPTDFRRENRWKSLTRTLKLRIAGLVGRKSRYSSHSIAETALQKLLILNGPNLNLLGLREPEIYGALTLDGLKAQCIETGKLSGFAVDFRQTNAEHELVNWLQEAGLSGTIVIFNPGAYSHTSIALHDAIKGANTKVIEVHISNIHAREEFRHHSFVSAVAKGVIVGLGVEGYSLAIKAAATLRDTTTFKA